MTISGSINSANCDGGGNPDRPMRLHGPGRGVTLRRSFAAFAADIKLSHSVFALPFAASVFPLLRLPPPELKTGVLLIFCMVLARSFAMGANRFLDRRIDRLNTRTAGRAIPSGAMTGNEMLGWSLVSAALFIVAAFQINRLCGWLSVPLLGVLAAYSVMKRLTVLTHWYLGMCLGLAPLAVEVAVAGRVSLPTVCLAAAVMFWTAGFDLLYALQDLKFDRAQALKSVPAGQGAGRAVLCSRLSFAAMTLLLLLAGWLVGAGFSYQSGVVVIGSILAWEHWLLRDVSKTGDTSRINAVFFNWNAAVSVIFLLFVSLDMAVRSL